MNLDYEIAVAEEVLEEAKRAAQDYLTPAWYTYFEVRVTLTIKREALSFNFSSGGNAMWYADVFRLVSNWIKAEWDHSKLLGKKLDCAL